jgi:hypothetical protein
MHQERLAPQSDAPDLSLTHAPAAAGPADSSVRGAWLLPLIVLTIAILWTIGSIVPLGAAARFLPFTILCAVPGVVLARRLYRNSTTSWLFALLIGGTWGYAFSSLTLLALWVAGVRRPIWLVLAPIATAFICSRVRPIASPLRVPLLGKRDVAAVCLTLLMVPAIVGRPYSRVGEMLPDGQAWRAYFTADFVWAMAVVSEVSKGDVPPQNPYRVGAALHYYWLAHLIPSIEHRLTMDATSLRQLLLANAVLAGLVFVGFFYLFVRHFVESPAAAAMACIAAVLFHSFEGTEQLFALWQLGAPLDLVRYLNIDAVTRWIYHSMPVDGLQRLLLYQPQHQLGYVMGLSALLLLVQIRDAARAGVMALAGLFIAMSLLLSTFSALMIATVASVFQGVRLVAGRRASRIPIYALVALLPIAGAVFLGRYLKYVEAGGPLVSFMVNETAWHRAPFAIVLSFGAMLAGAIAGSMFAWRRKALAQFALPAAIIAISWFFYFFVDVRDHQHVYVGWRAGHLLFIAFAPLVGFACQEYWRAGGAIRMMGVAATLLLIGAAAPTAAIDLYNTQDTSNRQEAPGFHWTLVIPHDELEALNWVRQHTPANATVQVDPEVRDPETWAYIPAFAERRMGAGLPISMIPLARYQRATSRVLEIYRASTADAAYLAALATGVDYVFVAPLERQRHPAIEATLDASPTLWPCVFRNGSVSIYQRARNR